MSSAEIDLIIAVTGIGLFLYKNPILTFKYWISAFVLGLITSEFFFYFNYSTPGQWIWVFSSLGLLATYSIRFKRKTRKGLIEYLKLIAIVLLVIYPWTIYEYINIARILRQFTFLFIGTIFLYDRWILKPEKMKRKYIIIVVGQTLLIFVLLVFSYIQKLEADKQVIRTEIERHKNLNAEKKIKELQVELENTRQQ